MEGLKFDTVIFHAPCNDGYGSAYIVWRYCREKNLTLPEFIGLHPTDPAPDVTGKSVLVADITWGRQSMIKMQKDASFFLVLDHHLPAQKELEGLDFVEIDNDRSALMMVWDYFYPKQPIMPLFLYYIGLRDIWKHEGIAEAVAFNAQLGALNSFYQLACFENGKVNFLICVERGKSLVQKQQQFMPKYAAEFTLDRTRKGFNFKIVEAHKDLPISELGNHLIRDSCCVALVWRVDEKVESLIHVSLRSDGKLGPDVSEIAKEFGGGGHKNAAGFRLKNKSVESIFQ